MSEDDFKKMLEEFEKTLDRSRAWHRAPDPSSLLPKPPIDVMILRPSAWERLREEVETGYATTRADLPTSILGFPVITFEAVPEDEIFMVKRPSLRFEIPEMDIDPYLEQARKDMADAIAMSFRVPFGLLHPYGFMSIDVVATPESGEEYLLRPWQAQAILLFAFVLLVLLLGLL